MQARRLSTLAVLLLSAGAALAQSDWQMLNDRMFYRSRYYDADSFHVIGTNTEEIFRLYFVDAPEGDTRFGRSNWQAQYFGVQEARILQSGWEAATFVCSLLTNKLTIATKWNKAGGQSRLPRYYAVVMVNGRDLAEILVENGYARVYGRKTDYPDGKEAAEVEARLRALEQQAKANRVGIWRYRRGRTPHPPVQPSIE